MKKIVSIVIAALLLTPAFAQENPITKYLPAGASMVMSFNPVKISKKVPGETFRQSFLYQEVFNKDNSGDLKAFWSDPSISGIDFTHDLVVVAVKDTAGEKKGVSFSVFGVLKSESVFAGFIKKLTKEQDPVRVYGTNKILASGDGGSTMGWNNEVFVLSIANKKQIQGELYGAYNDTSAGADVEKKMEELKYRLQIKQRNLCFELLTPKTQNPFYSNMAFANVINGPGDIKLWNDGSPNPALAGINPMAEMISKQLQSFTGKNKTTVINFENGKITSKTQSFIEGPVAEIFKKYPVMPMNTDLLRRLPKGTILGLMVMSVNTDMTREMMQKSPMGGLIEKMKDKIPFDLGLLNASFKSNMMLAVIKSDDADTDPAGGKMKGLKLILAIPIADKAKFDELKTALSRTLDSLKGPGNGEKNMFKDLKAFVKHNDNLLVLSLSEKVAEDFLANPGTETPPEWLQSYSGYPMVMSLNMKALIDMLFQKTGGQGGAKEEQAKKIFALFDKMIITGGNYENGSLNSSMEFWFSNHDDNALKQLFDMVNMGMQQKAKANMERQDEKKEEKTENVQEGTKDPLPPPPPPPKKPVKKTKGQ